MTFINLTPHEITLFREDGGSHMLPPSEKPARVRMLTSVQGNHNGVPVVGQPIASGLENLPPINKQEFTLYIVSRIVKDAVPDRYDCVVPNDIVRDSKGNIMGCRSVAL
jgi:hypothetical protein